LTLALMLAAGAAHAQTTVITRERVQTVPTETRTVTVPAQTQTVVTTTEQRPLQLSPGQRQTIYRTITRERVKPAQQTVEYRVGARVPSGVELYTVPQEVVTEVPAVKTYKYMVVNDRVWLVDPNTSEVVAEVDQ
jgi:hypothetical protein